MWLLAPQYARLCRLWSDIGAFSAAPCCRSDQARSRLMRRPCRVVVSYAMSGNAEGRSSLPFVVDLADCLACLHRRLGPDRANGATARCEPSPGRVAAGWSRNMSASIYPQCYYTSIDILPALNPPTIMTFSFCRADIAAQIRRSDEDQESDQARFQELETCRCAFGRGCLSERLLGR